MDFGIKQIGIFLLCVMLLSCNSNDYLQHSLDYAGNNRAELEKVLHHYKDDEQKHEAAVFLISNIGGRYATVGERVDGFHHFIDSVYRIRQEEYDIPAIYNAFRNRTRNSYASTRREHDLKHVSSEYLIRHIDRSFELWNRLWNSHLSFEEFCEWILPYRLHDEQLESWHDIFRPVFDSLLTDTVRTAAQACVVINNRLKELPIHIALETVRPSAIRPSSLINTMYWLRNLTRGREERIFTYEDGK